MANKRARSNEVQTNNDVHFMVGLRESAAKKRRCQGSNAPPRRHISQCLDPRLHPPHYPDPFRPMRPVTPPVYHNPFPVVPPPVVVPSFAVEPEFEPMDWQPSVYREIVVWSLHHQWEEETPMDWE